MASPLRKFKVIAAQHELITSKAGIVLDISFAGIPQPNSVVLSSDLKHNPRMIPFPLPDQCVNTCVITHVLEYIPPQHWFAWMDELHRVMKPYGAVYASGPYGGDESQGWLSDPTHMTRIIEQTWAWLDPRTPFYKLHKQCGREQPKPWHPQTIARVPGTHGTISYNVTLTAQPEDK